MGEWVGRAVSVTTPSHPLSGSAMSVSAPPPPCRGPGMLSPLHFCHCPQPLLESPISAASEPAAASGGSPNGGDAKAVDATAEINPASRDQFVPVGPIPDPLPPVRQVKVTKTDASKSFFRQMIMRVLGVVILAKADLWVGVDLRVQRPGCACQTGPGLCLVCGLRDGGGGGGMRAKKSLCG